MDTAVDQVSVGHQELEEQHPQHRDTKQVQATQLEPQEQLELLVVVPEFRDQEHHIKLAQAQPTNQEQAALTHQALATNQAQDISQAPVINQVQDTNLDQGLEQDPSQVLVLLTNQEEAE